MLIEVHGRCQVASTIAKITKTAKVALFLHNDPRQMTGSKTLAERLWLARNLAGIFANSNYIKNFIYYKSSQMFSLLFTIIPCY